jgi:ABC-type glycerol-3-phosphate transport system substrate-binding protein
MTSPDVQHWRVLVAGFIPTIPAVAQDAEVREALPYIERFDDVQFVVRPARYLGDDYTMASINLFNHVHTTLRGEASAAETVPLIAADLERLVR